MEPSVDMLSVFEPSLLHYILLSLTLFVIGLAGLLTQRNIIRMLMSVELMLNAVNINFVAFNRFVDPSELTGQLFSIFILTVAAAEVAVGLAIVIALYRGYATVDIESFDTLRG